MSQEVALRSSLPATAPSPAGDCGRLIREATERDFGSHLLKAVPGWEPPALTAEQRRSLIAYERALMEYLQAGDQDQIALRVEALLAHWKADQPASQQIGDIVVADWLNILGRYPTTVVMKACEEYLETGTYRPHISDIRAICDRLCHDDRVRLDVVRQLLRTSSSELFPQIAAPAT